jgi:NAD(P)-dependent dehydrogenase (short-subunit alcohol dehydrogenase family)
MGRLDRKIALITGGNTGIGRLEDIAETAVFHASKDADFYKGQMLGPSGGEFIS